MRRLQDCSKFRSQSVERYGYVFHDTNGQNCGRTLKVQLFLLSVICTQHHLSHAFFLTTGSLSSCSQLFVIVSQHARTSVLFRFHNAHALPQGPNGSSIVSQMSLVKHSSSPTVHPPSLLHRSGHVDLHFSTALSSSPPTATLPRSAPT